MPNHKEIARLKAAGQSNRAIADFLGLSRNMVNAAVIRIKDSGLRFEDLQILTNAQIVGNCDEFLYLGGNEQGTHKYVSELLGKTHFLTAIYMAYAGSGYRATDHNKAYKSRQDLLMQM